MKWKIYRIGPYQGFDEYPWVLQKPSGFQFRYNEWRQAVKWLDWNLRGRPDTI